MNVSPLEFIVFYFKSIGHTLSRDTLYLSLFCASICCMFGVGVFQLKVVEPYWIIYSLWCLFSFATLGQLAWHIYYFKIHKIAIIDSQLFITKLAEENKSYYEMNLKLLDENKNYQNLSEKQESVVRENPNSKVVTFIVKNGEKFNLTEDQFNKILNSNKIEEFLSNNSNEASH